jgi:hypothetical protein
MSFMITRSWDFVLFNKEFYHCVWPKPHVLARHFLVMKYDHVTGAGDVTVSYVGG